MSKKKIKRIKLKINWKQFVVSYAIWWLGAIISIIPTLAAYLNLKALSGNLTELTFWEHLFNDSNMIYSVVSVVVVAFSDLVLNLVREETEFKTLKWLLFCISILGMISASLVFGLSSNWSKEVPLIAYIVKDAFVVAFLLCTLIYLVNNAETTYKGKGGKV